MVDMSGTQGGCITPLTVSFTKATLTRYAHRYTVFCGLLLLVVAWNVFQADQTRFVYAANATGDYLHVDPRLANGVLASLDEFTPLINESAVDLSKTLTASTDEGFVSASDVGNPFTTESTKLEVTYTVQKGDTISSIADKFGLHVATIAERNQIGIDKIENITPGSTLIIPPVDTSDSTEWLAELNQLKENERQKAIAAAEKARRATRGRSRSTSRQIALSGFDGSASSNFVVPIGHNGISRGVSRYHAGIDYRANVGTTVRAAQDGKVIETTGGWAGGFGNSILVDHGGGLTTRYAHLSEIDVSVGQVVSQGEAIGHSGNTGYSTGPHLHFETRKNGSVISPF